MSAESAECSPETEAAIAALALLRRDCERIAEDPRRAEIAIWQAHEASILAASPRIPAASAAKPTRAFAAFVSPAQACSSRAVRRTARPRPNLRPHPEKHRHDHDDDARRLRRRTPKKEKNAPEPLRRACSSLHPASAISP